MIINPIQPHTPSFGINRTKKIMIDCVDDIVMLQNGKRFDLFTYKDTQGNLKYKLYYLSEKSGKWIKSKLKCFQGNKLVKILRGESNNDI